MNRLARWMMRLYPAQWRARYGDEIDALLADTGADARTVTDLAKGGVRMQFSTWSFPKLTLTLGLAGLLLGAAFSLFLPSEYVSMATLQIMPARLDATATTGISNPLNGSVQRLAIEVESRARLTPILRKLNLYPDPTLDDVVERMKNDIQITFVNAPKQLEDSAAFDIRFTYPDRYKAQQTVKALMTAFLDVNQASVADRPVSPIFVLDEATLPAAGPLGSFLETFMPHEYRSKATLGLTHGTDAQVSAIAARAFGNDSLSAVLNDPRFMLYRDESRTMSPGDVLRLMRSHLQILHQGNHDGAVFDIVFGCKDRYKARQTVEALTNRFLAASAEMFPASAHDLAEPPAILDVLDTASLPVTPSKPDRPLIALVSGVLGILLGALISIVRRLRTPPAIATLNAVNG